MVIELFPDKSKKKKWQKDIRALFTRKAYMPKSLGILPRDVLWKVSKTFFL